MWGGARPFIFFAAISFATPARASSVSLDLRHGSDVSEQTLSAGGEFNESSPDDPRSFWEWRASLLHGRTTEGATTDDATIGRAGLEYTTESRWSFALDAFDGAVPNENLTEFGAEAELTYEFQWAHPHRRHPRVDEFIPWLSVGLAAGATNYVETFRGARQVRRKGRLYTTPTEGEIAAPQTHLRVDFSGSPWEDWKFGLALTTYAYNRNIEKLENTLSTPAALRRGVAGFSNVVGGFPSAGVSINLTWYVSNRWRLSASESINRLVVDQSPSRVTEILLGFDVVKDFRLSLGVERDVSDTLTDTLGVLVGRYRF